LKPWQAKNLLKYRAKGGKYRKNEDLKKLYGMTDSMYNALSPYIYIARDTTITDTIAADSARIDSLPKWKSQKKDTILNLRTADTTELKMIKGIGSYRAKQIVKYREQLGGFVRVEQIMEAKGMEKAVADSILPHFFLDSIIIKPLMVNKIRPENLSKHPYINFEKAKAIYEYRRRHIRIRSKEELQKIDALNAEDIKKIEIYLDFSD
jgi:competence ComEA-like helix-hairpin-helix protein